jgi:hypothetical protein
MLVQKLRSRIHGAVRHAASVLLQAAELAGLRGDAGHVVLSGACLPQTCGAQHVAPQNVMHNRKSDVLL